MSGRIVISRTIISMSYHQLYKIIRSYYDLAILANMMNMMIRDDGVDFNRIDNIVNGQLEDAPKLSCLNRWLPLFELLYSILNSPSSPLCSTLFSKWQELSVTNISTTGPATELLCVTGFSSPSKKVLYGTDFRNSVHYGTIRHTHTQSGYLTSLIWSMHDINQSCIWSLWWLPSDCLRCYHDILRNKGTDYSSYHIAPYLSQNHFILDRIYHI